ncbi:MAG: glycosyltransferase family 4 protein, partial [FCB group bacterium]|nr:glycosyltransferase family 4 protein [FCB group bacterium]
KKGQHILIEACAMVHKAGYPFHLLIVGEESLNEQTHYAEDLRQLTEQLNLKEFVHFLPYQKKIEMVYKALDLFVLTSQSETYGMVTIEAMASGLPVIATNAGGTKGIIEDNVNGLLVTPFGVSELAGAVIRIISDRELRYRLATQARKDALEKYSHLRQCKRLEELFARLE